MVVVVAVWMAAAIVDGGGRLVDGGEMRSRAAAARQLCKELETLKETRR